MQRTRPRADKTKKAALAGRPKSLILLVGGGLSNKPMKAFQSKGYEIQTKCVGPKVGPMCRLLDRSVTHFGQPFAWTEGNASPNRSSMIRQLTSMIIILGESNVGKWPMVALGAGRRPSKLRGAVVDPNLPVATV